MKMLLNVINDRAKLYRDTNNGIAWIEDTSTGNSISCHANIDSSGSVRGMKKLGYWKNTDRTIRSHGFIYNIDTYVVNINDPFERIVAAECKCDACIQRRKY